MPRSATAGSVEQVAMGRGEGKARIDIPRSDAGPIAARLSRNGSAVAMGGRGMGKSVFLGQVKAELDADPGTRAVLVDGPPAPLTVEACLDSLARTLGVASDPYSSRPLFDEYFSRGDAPERLVLLFDELCGEGDALLAAAGPGLLQRPGGVASLAAAARHHGRRLDWSLHRPRRPGVELSGARAPPEVAALRAPGCRCARRTVQGPRHPASRRRPPKGLGLHAEAIRFGCSSSCLISS